MSGERRNEDGRPDKEIGNIAEAYAKEVDGFKGDGQRIAEMARGRRGAKSFQRCMCLSCSWTSCMTIAESARTVIIRERTAKSDEGVS
jgi:hypothetical protein